MGCNCLQGAFSSGGGGGAGGAWSFVEAFTLASSAATWTITPSTALDLTGYDEFAVAVVLKHITSAGDLQLTFNGLTADFFFIGSENDSGTATSINQSAQSEVTIFGTESAGKTSQIGRASCRERV